MATIVNKPMSEEQIAEAVRLACTGMTRKAISDQMGITYQSVTRELRKLGVKIGKRVLDPATLEFKPATEETALTPAIPTPLQPVPATPTEFEERANKLADNLLVGAERLVNSINNMTDAALQASPLNHRTAAIDKMIGAIESLKGTKNGLFGNKTGAVNIVNIISRSMPGRLKDMMPTEDAEVIDDNPQ